MQTFAIYIPPRDLSLSSGEASVRAKFLSDSKSILALIMPLVWLIWNKLWFALGLYVLYGFSLMLISRVGYETLAVVLSGLPGLYLLLEGRQMILQKLELEGWQYRGVVLAANEEDATDRFFRNDSVLDVSQSGVKVRSQNKMIQKPAIARPIGPLGLFPE